LIPAEINNLITVSCTGFFAPGLDYHLINEFKINSYVKRTNIGFMGCAASVVGFNSVLDILYSDVTQKKNILLVSVELCSLHLQTEPTKDNILANMIFADGSAAALFSNDYQVNNKIKLKLISTDSVLFDNSEKYMGWKIGNFGFEMILSSDLPRIINEEAVPAIKNILASKNISLESVKYWALHPGGRAILDSLQTGLSLSNKQLIPSRTVLSNFGNMSSASILFVMKEILDKEIILKGDYCCVVAFGPGLTMEVAVFQGG
jgi:predicted naringenin-chalcone synthase